MHAADADGSMPLLLALAGAVSRYEAIDPDSEFERWAAGHETGPMLHKDQHYYHFAIYERHFFFRCMSNLRAPPPPLRTRMRASSRQRPIRLLEIGVQSGGSLEMWKSYFGEELHLHGIDINPGILRFANRSRHIHMHIGSTSDERFMAELAHRLPPLEFVIDDGSHHSMDIWRAFAQLPAGAHRRRCVPRRGPSLELLVQ